MLGPFTCKAKYLCQKTISIGYIHIIEIAKDVIGVRLADNDPARA